MLFRRASRAPGRGAAPVLVLAALLAGCSHDWDFFDPLPVSGAGAAGPGGPGARRRKWRRRRQRAAATGAPARARQLPGAAAAWGRAPALNCAAQQLLQDDVTDDVPPRTGW